MSLTPRSLPVSLPTPQMVGRDFEMARILDVYKRVEDGKASTVVIRGAGGIGKSRLAEMILERTESMGAVGLTGRASRFDRGIPYALVNEFLQPLQMDNESITNSSIDLKNLLDTTAGIAAGKQKSNKSHDVLGLATSILKELSRISPLVISCDDLSLIHI